MANRDIILLMIGLILVSSLALAEISGVEKKELGYEIRNITELVNNNDIDGVISMLSPDARQGLKDEIESELVGKQVEIKQSIFSYKEMENGHIWVKCRFSASGPGWNINGLTNKYVFEKSGDTWLIVDTDFHKKMSGTYILKIMGKIFLVVAALFLVLGGFWLWMLIDCVMRDFDDKVMWILIIIFLNFIGAVLYFFLMRWKLVREKNTPGKAH